MVPYPLRYAVIGAGHGGQAVAAYLARQGVRVRLLNKTFERIRAVVKAGGIRLKGVVQGFGRLELATTNWTEAVATADTIMVAVPASAHRSVARRLAPILRHGQVVVLNPGRTGGAFEFRSELNRSGCEAVVTVVEAQTFPFASRITGPAEVTIFGIKKRVPVAALPAIDTPMVVSEIRRVLPPYVAARTVLETSFDNIGAIFHPTPLLFNAERILATGGNFDYYHDGITPAVASVLEDLDSERLRIAQAFGVRATPARDWVRIAYGSKGDTLYEVIQNNASYRGIKAPDSLNHRYIFEDVPASLVPLADFGRLAGVRTPTLDAVIELAEAVTGINYRAIGRTIERMGLSGRSIGDVIRCAWSGQVAAGLTG